MTHDCEQCYGQLLVLSTPEDHRARAELDHQHARREVERLHLIVRLVGPSEGGQG